MRLKANDVRRESSSCRLVLVGLDQPPLSPEAMLRGRLTTGLSAPVQSS